ncbi:MAG: translation initiation factor eIF-1A [Candidatus Aenigmatarchaeota archaeon]
MPDEGKSKLRQPEDDQVLGKVIELLGADRLRVECEDGNERIVRIPGRLKKRVWVNRDDIIIVEPWDIEKEEKGDMVWRYNKNKIPQLKKRGYLKRISVS